MQLTSRTTKVINGFSYKFASQKLFSGWQHFILWFMVWRKWKCLAILRQLPRRTTAILDNHHPDHIEFSTCIAIKAISTSQGAVFLSKILKSQMFLRPLNTSTNLGFNFNTFGWRMSYQCHNIFVKFLYQCKP